MKRKIPKSLCKGPQRLAVARLPRPPRASRQASVACIFTLPRCHRLLLATRLGLSLLPVPLP
jgi:hypothetical protein